MFESNSTGLPTYFVEVQFQEDRRFYDRTIPQIMLYLAQTEQTTDWHFVIWTARPSLLPTLPVKYQSLSSNITIVFLNQLCDMPNKPLGVTLIDLIVCPVHQAQVKVSELLTKVQRLSEPNLQRVMIDLMETVLVYKFDKLSRREIETMFGLSELKQTRVYQEAKEEGIEIGRQEGRQIGRQEGVRLGQVRLLIRQLSLRFGTLSQSQQERISALSLEELERLGEDLLNWKSPDDLPDWLREV